jgi:hypothetical protein
VSAIKELVGKGIEGSTSDEADGPKGQSVTAGYLKRMWSHMKEGDFEAAAECFNKAVSVGPDEEDEEEEGPESSRE